jgi:uncharacterized protein (UPF0335 family)
MIPSNELIRFFQNLETMEESKKAIADDIKDGIDAFANNNGVNPKALKRAYRDYKEYQKGKQEFVTLDTEAGALLDSVIPEYQEAD